LLLEALLYLERKSTVATNASNMKINSTKNNPSPVSVDIRVDKTEIIGNKKEKSNSLLSIGGSLIIY
jgi:hypothetical protein